MPINTSIYQNVGSFNSRLRFVTGSVTITGASGAISTVAADTKGRGFTVAKTGTGLYTITLSGASGFLQQLFRQVNLIANVAAGYTVHILAASDANRTINIQISADATPDTPAHPPAASIIQLLVAVNDVATGQQ
jgi:hypothetical protein